MDIIQHNLVCKISLTGDGAVDEKSFILIARTQFEFVGLTEKKKSYTLSKSDMEISETP